MALVYAFYIIRSWISKLGQVLSSRNRFSRVEIPNASAGRNLICDLRVIFIHRSIIVMFHGYSFLSGLRFVLIERTKTPSFECR